mmetsp:Transcript_27194/g.39824  ORF Transcript_27194/g.39824 Transcript_27194/m.39824 type:complete len:127 (-) Transcript_27194:12-392(-)
MVVIHRFMLRMVDEKYGMMLWMRMVLLRFLDLPVVHATRKRRKEGRKERKDLGRTTRAILCLARLLALDNRCFVVSMCVWFLRATVGRVEIERVRVMPHMHKRRRRKTELMPSSASTNIYFRENVV